MENQNNFLEVVNPTTNEEIKNLIYTVRGKQVMLDSDVARLYEYETKKLNQAVKRNIERFPEEFCFQLNEYEIKNMWSQIVTASNMSYSKFRNNKYLPYAFTEQGVVMLAGILKSEIAINMSIKIIESFVEMRHFLYSNNQFSERLINLEYKQIENEKNFKQLFNMFENKDILSQKVFFQGQIFDAYELIINIIKTAKNKILLIDN